jgi:GDP-4-dehydro-6-deoxy-D-mannose reductase
MKIMITGAAGFIGGFLAKKGVEADCTVLGIGLSEPEATWAGSLFERCDVRDASRLSHVVSTFKPDRIFHMAAQSYPTVSLEKPLETIESNVGGTVNLFEAVRKLEMPPVVIVACSSAEYGPVAAADLPVREEHPLRPLHPYGVSKVGQDLLTAQYYANYKLPCVRIRIFNTTGPGKLGDVCSDFAHRAVEIELGTRTPTMMVGNLTKRAIVDVRDLVRGLWMSADHCQFGDVYNLGATRIYPIQEVIDSIRAKTNVPFSIESDPALVRGCDELVIAGDITKFQQRTGWAPEVSLETTLQDMLDWWRKKLSVKEPSRTVTTAAFRQLSSTPEPASV